jgi:hypothetical protein
MALREDATFPVAVANSSVLCCTGHYLHLFVLHGTLRIITLRHRTFSRKKKTVFDKIYPVCKKIFFISKCPAHFTDRHLTKAERQLGTPLYK